MVIPRPRHRLPHAVERDDGLNARSPLKLSEDVEQRVAAGRHAVRRDLHDGAAACHEPIHAAIQLRRVRRLPGRGEPGPVRSDTVQTVFDDAR